LPGWASTVIAALGFLMVTADLVLAFLDRRRNR
jgi:hypothetical protein